MTFLNDLCLLAPAALLTPAIRWEAVDDRQARAIFTLGVHTISATLVFADDGRLADFWSDDRGRAEPGGAVAQGQRWSTPVAEWRAFGPFTLMARGDARWHAPGGTFAYIELAIDAVAYNVTMP